MSTYLPEKGEKETKSGNTPEKEPDLHQPEIHASLDRYWHKNLFMMTILLLAWAFVGLGCGVIFADYFNQFMLLGTGYPLGFWFAQQGSILTFVLLILAYCVFMNRMDIKHHQEIEKIQKEKLDS
jgi:putative solute:sodium symporter small subunit